VLIDDGGGTTITEGASPDAEAAATLLGGEPTVHAFSPERVEQAMRFEYVAVESGVVFGILAGAEAQKSPALINTVARQVAYQLNQDAKVPGVADMEETQVVSPLGSVDDIWQIAITSTSGKVTQIFNFGQQSMRPDIFAQNVAALRAGLDQYG
jgi:hypothetical protein